MAGKPFTWVDYNQGRQRQSSTGSQGSGRITFADDSERTALLGARSSSDRAQSASGLRRRSSIGAAMNSIAQAGGVNSIESFARSWQRAAGFHEFAHSRDLFAVANDEDIASHQGLVPDEERVIKPKPSLLRQQLSQVGTPPETAIQDPLQEPADDLDANMPLLGRSPSRSMFASPFSSSFTGGTYGSFSSRENDHEQQQAARAFLEQASGGPERPEKYAEPLLIHQVEQPDGKISIEVIGQSTLYQTVLNSTNVLIGVGIMSLPLAFRFAGWIVGAFLITLAAFTTAYTAKLLGRCLDVDRSMITYSDIALYAYGKVAEIGIGLIFTFELLTACVALVVLFGDTLHLLIPTFGIVEFEILAGLISIPLAFVPLRYLGITSMLGIFCCVCIVVLVFIAGLVKPDAPGSLIDPAATYLFPQHWTTLPLSVGLMMSPWGGHAVFPQFYRDMRHPHKYGTAVTATFSITYVVDAAIAVVGLLMFGDDTRAEITSNIFETEGYPRLISFLIILCIAVIPLTKLPLNAQPVFSVADNLLGLREPVVDGDGHEALAGRGPRSKLVRSLLYASSRVGVMAVITTIAIFCPGFDRIMAFMGSLFCMVVCVCCPVAFYLKLCADEIGPLHRIGLYIMGGVGLVLAATGTAFALLPPSITKASR